MELESLERYARHIVLREIGGLGQKRLMLAKILIIGAGGLGSPALSYLAAAGVGTLGIIDGDRVSLSNLQRQTIFGTNDIGELKVKVTKQALLRLNPNVEVIDYPEMLDAENAKQIIDKYDIVLDGSDNFKTRYLVNLICFRLQKPLLSAAISQWDGQMSLYDPSKGTPCYECIFPEQKNSENIVTCSEGGVLGSLPGIIGTMMATETLKFLVKAGKLLLNEMIIYNALSSEMHRYRIYSRSTCKVCKN